MIGIYKYKIVDNEHLYGPNKRLLVFFKGCKIHCEGCVNKHLWSFENADLMDVKELIDIILKENLGGITLHGGEPLDQKEELIKLVKELKKINKSVILFTGYKKKELDSVQASIWNMADIVISGRFIKEKLNFNLQFRGSSNQRVYTHKGIYKNYKVNDGKSATILTIDNNGDVNINGFLTDEIIKILN